MMNPFICFIVIFFLSCEGGDPMSAEEIAIQELLDDPRPKILMSMSEDLELTINVQKFEESISYMTFQMVFNHEALEASSFSQGDFGLPWSNMDHMDVNNDTIYCSFSFSSDIVGSGDLLKIKFDRLSASSYQKTTIYMASVLFEDPNGDEIEFEESNPLLIQDVCYINGFESGGEWTDFGDYVWSNAFCWPLNYEP